MLKWIMQLILDQAGETVPQGQAAGGGSSAQGLGGSDAAGSNENNGASPDQGDNTGEQEAQGASSNTGTAGQGQQAPAASPKYGEFGEAPTVDQLFEALQRERRGIEHIKSKTNVTERNLASLRKALEGSGIRAVVGADGNVKFEVIQQEQRQKKFTDQHLQQLAQMFDKPESAKTFLDLLSLHVQDLFEDQYSSRQKMTQEEQARVQQMVKARDEQIDTMFDLYPMLNPKLDASGNPSNPEFNKAFYDLATEIWQKPVEDGGFGGHPLKQMLAAIKAAKQLGVVTNMIQKAQAQGYQQGQAGKRIVGPVQSGAGAAAGAGSAGMRPLTRDEYLALTEEKREAYDAWVVQQRK